MNEIITSVSPAVITSSSRIMQEAELAQGNISVYGKVSDFLCVSMDQIDQCSHEISGWVSDKAIHAVQDKYYHDNEHKFRSARRRHIYISPSERRKMEFKSQAAGIGAGLLTELGIQLSFRGLQILAHNREEYKTFEQMYAVLCLFLQDAEKGSDIELAAAELSKIRNSFPISVRKKRKLRKKYSEADQIGKLNPSRILSGNNTQLRDATAYFLTALNKQLYKDEKPRYDTLANYYSLLDLNGTYGKSMMEETGIVYDEIAMNQAIYLDLSRRITKKLAVKMPDIDVRQIISRNAQAAKFDPYAVHRRKVKTASIGLGEGLISILAKRPDIFIQGMSTALSQFTQDERLIDSAQELCRELPIGSKDAENILQESVAGAQTIKAVCDKNDDNTPVNN